MSEYIVKTHENRNLVIEADKYNFNNTESAYEFFAKGDVGSSGHSNMARSSAGAIEGGGLTKVATIPVPGVFAIIKNEAEKSDYYHVYDWNEEEEKEETGDICNDCLLEQFVKSDAFFDEVYSIVDFYHNPDNKEEAATAAVPKEEYPIEHWRDKNGREWWGFRTPEGLVHFSSKDSAIYCRENHIKNPTSGWVYLDTSTSTRLED